MGGVLSTIAKISLSTSCASGVPKAEDVGGRTGDKGRAKAGQISFPPMD